jgi:hypothetical protein
VSFEGGTDFMRRELRAVILLDWRTIGLDLVGLDMAGLDSVVSLLWIGLDRLVWRLLELQWLYPIRKW